MEMHAVLRHRLEGWQIHRRHNGAADYFLVTAVRVPGLATDKCTSFAFPRSRGGRHLLTVRRGPWVFVNVHAESGGKSFERDERACQLDHMSRSHEQKP